MRRGILLISILVAGMILILSAAMLSYIFRDSDTKGLNIINSTDGSDGHQPPPNTQTSAALEENKNIGSIANVPNNCLGSALCQD
jgi:flagellar basal body-associated protein FliL